MIIKNMKRVPQNIPKFGLLGRVKAWYKAFVLEGLVIKKCIKQIKQP